MKNNEQFYTFRGYEIIADENKLTASMEDYLEMIYRLNQKQNDIRVNDLAIKLNVQPPSVTKMIQKLNNRGFLKYQKYGLIHLTAEGKEVGAYLIKRHNTIKEFLNLIGATENLQKDVETLEHSISFSTLEVFSLLIKFLNKNDYIIKEFNLYKEGQNK